MSSKRIYNRVMQANNVCPLGELLTDKELERLKQNNVPRDWPFTMKVKVQAMDVYFSFGARMVHCDYELLAGEYTTEELERILSSPYGKALDTKDYGVCLGVIAARREPLREFQPGDYVDWHGYSATVIDVDGDFITLDVCGEEVYTDTQELIQQQL